MDADLERLNSFYDEVCGKPLIPPPPSLKAIETFLKRHLTKAEPFSKLSDTLDIALEAVEEARRIK